MTLTFKHFDTRLGEWIHTDGNRDNPESLLVETLDNTLLEVYLPNLEFSFGHIDEKSTPADLHRHPSGQVLLLSSKSRMLFGPPEALDTIETLCPDKKDRGAYGSIFLGACHNAIARELNVLVVDDKTGANGGLLPDDVAWRQVGDCHGKCSPALARELSDTTEHVIQHRMALPEEMRFAKGTLAPKDLTQLPSRHPDTPIDLIVPTSSFKGGDKKNHPIEPGLHTTTVWLGEKDRSKEGTVAISQVHASFPTGIKDYLRSLEAQAQILHDRQKDPRKLAEYYCEQHEKRQALASETPEEQPDPIVYRIIKADLESGHGQLLESPKVQGELNRFVQNRWKEIAIGKTIEFDRGLIIPSKDLKHGEICVPSLSEGEEVLNFRSPLLNSNGMCVSLNKYVDDALAPNGKPLTGVIVVNDEDRNRIQARLDALKAQGIETDERVPVETESERQGRDYDGDCIGVARALDFQGLSAEAKFRNRPENAYAPVEKAEKVSFPEAMSFEEIAIFMSDGISVGVINNHATAIEALESEIDLLRESGTESDRIEYVGQVGAHYHKLLQSDAENEPISESYRERASQIADIARGDLNPEAIDRALTLNRSIYHDLVGEAAKENQKAVDIFKSNNPPDLGKIRQNDRLLYRIPNYIRDKKQAGVYSAPDRTLATPGYSPVELMVRQANGYFQAAALEPRPMQQFRDLFPDDYTPAQKQAVVAAKHEFDRRFNLAAAYNTKLKTEKGPVLKVTTARGTQFEVTNLTRFDAIDTLAGRNLDIKLVENRKYSKFPHRLLALAKTDTGRYEPLGTVCEMALEREGLHANLETRNAQTQLSASVTEKQVKLMFVGVREFAVEFRQSLREAERPRYAAAAWHLATTVESQRSGGQPYKTSNFVFAAFGEEILGQLGTLQLRTCVATGIQHDENQLPDETWQDGRPLNLEIGVNSDPDSQRYGKPVILIEDPSDRQYKEFGLLNQHNAQLPIGTRASATIAADPPATATLSLDGDDWTWIVGHTSVTAPPRSDAAISMAFGAGLEDLQRAIEMAHTSEVSAVSAFKSSREELAAVGDSQIKLAPEPPPPEVGATAQSACPSIGETEASDRSRRLAATPAPPAPPASPAPPTPPAPLAHQTRVDRNLEYSYTTARGGLERVAYRETPSLESVSEVKSPPKPEKSQTQPPSVPSFLPEKLPMSDRLSPSIGQQVQQQRTQFVADVVARTLDLVGRHEHSGDEYAAKWNAQTGELTLLAAGEDTPRMVAKLEEGRWKATLGCRLSEEDRQFFEDLSPKLEHLEERQRQQKSSGIEQ